jgi:hypothetical protein
MVLRSKVPPPLVLMHVYCRQDHILHAGGPWASYWPQGAPGSQAVQDVSSSRLRCRSLMAFSFSSMYSTVLQNMSLQADMLLMCGTAWHRPLVHTIRMHASVLVTTPSGIMSVTGISSGIWTPHTQILLCSPAGLTLLAGVTSQSKTGGHSR